MAAKPYVGVTGPVTEGEVEGIIQEFTAAGYTMQSQHLPMVGFLASHKTLNGPAGNRRYPGVKNLPYLLTQADNRVFTTIHYNSREPGLAEQVSKVFDGVYLEGLCRAIQLNIVWPDVAEVRKIKDRFPSMSIIFQVSRTAMEGKSAKEIADGIEKYGDTLAYALIDPSGGENLEFDVDNSVAVFRELGKRLPSMSIGFAGSLNGDNVGKKVSELIEKTGTSEFSIDAESGLRDKVTDAHGDDLLNFSKVKAYLEAAHRVLP